MLIDTSATPRQRTLFGGGLNEDRIVTNQHYGVLDLTANSFALHRADCQLSQDEVRANKLLRELKGVPSLNAAILDAMIDNPELVPDAWFRYPWICFWGTIYEGPTGTYIEALQCYNERLPGLLAPVPRLVPFYASIRQFLKYSGYASDELAAVLVEVP